MELNLTAICATISDRLKLINFLLHREGSKPLLLSTLRAALLEKEPLSILTSIFEIFANAMSRYDSFVLELLRMHVREFVISLILCFLF
jgi:hypothetical protein